MTDESSITGETDPISKESAINLENPNLDCFILSGSKVIEGNG